MRPSGPSGSPSRATTGLGLTPAVHTMVRAATASPSDSVAPARVTRPQPGLSAHLDPASGAARVRRTPRGSGTSCMIRSLSLDQHPAHPLDAAAGIQLDGLRGEVLQLGQALDAGVAGADEHEAQVLGAPRRDPPATRLMSRQLSTWLRSAVASARDFRPIACSARPGIGKRARHRPQRDHQLVVVSAPDARRRAASLQSV